MIDYRDFIVTKILNEIQTNYSESEFNVTTLSEAMHMNRTTLFRTTKKFLDKSPCQLLDNYRLQRAKDMLHDVNVSLKDVAYSTGHTSYGYFATKFKKEFKVTPKEYKMQTA